jgi:hypothetical protein
MQKTGGLFRLEENSHKSKSKYFKRCSASRLVFALNRLFSRPAHHGPMATLPLSETSRLPGGLRAVELSGLLLWLPQTKFKPFGGRPFFLFIRY